MKSSKNRKALIVRGKKLSAWIRAVDGTWKLIATGKPDTPKGRKKAKEFAAALKLKVETERTKQRPIKMNFDITREVFDALCTLRDTGLYGNGRDCASVANELLRRALLDPEIALRWIHTTKLDKR